MNGDDIPQVMDIERESFPSMWPQTAYRRELQNKLARYIVLTEQSDEAPTAASSGRVWGTIRKIVGGEADATARDSLLGFIGVWLMAGDAHIVTVAVREGYRRMGIGERLLLECLELAIAEEQEVVTLVIVS